MMLLSVTVEKQETIKVALGEGHGERSKLGLPDPQNMSRGDLVGVPEATDEILHLAEDLESKYGGH